MVRFSAADKARITEAIHAAEQATSGEFVAVVARQSDHYLFLPLLWAALLALLVPGAFLLGGSRLAYIHLYQIQLATFVVLALLFLFLPPLHLALVPRAVKHHRASLLAKAQFYLQGVHLTHEHSGVLFFVSLAERYVEIVADQDIHEKIGEARWRTIIETFIEHVRRGEITEGFIAAIAACGASMAEHYPAKPGQSNELSDGLIEI